MRHKTDETLAAARERGQREGCAAGREEGLASLREALQAADKLMRCLEDERRRFAGRMERDMIELLLAIADKALFTVMDGDRERLISVVTKAVAMLAHKSSVTVRVNPEDLSLIEQARADLAAATEDGAIVFMADPGIARGDCRVIAPSGIVESDKEAFKTALEQQFRALADAGGGTSSPEGSGNSPEEGESLSI